MTFKQGVSGNPHGNRHRTRHLLNQEFMQALLLNFRHQGKEAIEKVARNQPAAYLKILALLVPREMKVEHAGGVKAMTDEQLEAGIEAIQAMLEQRAVEGATLIGSLPRSRHPRSSSSRQLPNPNDATRSRFDPPTEATGEGQMPNWCHNSMKITGTISEITRFKQTYIRTDENKQAQLDFDVFLPECRIFLAMTTHCRGATPGSRRGVIGRQSFVAPNGTLTNST